jgi:hypothetical protein
MLRVAIVPGDAAEGAATLGDDDHLRCIVDGDDLPRFGEIDVRHCHEAVVQAAFGQLPEQREDAFGVLRTAYGAKTHCGAVAQNGVGRDVGGITENGHTGGGSTAGASSKGAISRVFSAKSTAAAGNPAPARRHIPPRWHDGCLYLTWR